MAYLFFYLATVAACLLWTAAFTAAAARVKKFGWLLRIIALGIPLLAWVPWLSITAWLAFVRSTPKDLQCFLLAPADSALCPWMKSYMEQEGFRTSVLPVNDYVVMHFQRESVPAATLPKVPPADRR